MAKPKAEVVSVRIEAGQVLTDAHVAALRDPERLITSRHLRRDPSSGRLVARRDFQIAMNAGAL